MSWADAAVALSLIAAVQTASEQRCACPPTRQFPAGVGDIGSNTAYVAGADNRVTAVLLDSGSVLWQSAAATIPIGLVSGSVVAIRRSEDPREAQLALLDRRTGTVSLTSRPFRFGRDPTGDRVFGSTLFSTSDAAGTLTVRWRDLAPRLGGPERDIGRTFQGGGVEIAKDGAARVLPDEEQARDLNVAEAPAYHRGAESTSGSWGSGECIRTLSLEQGGGQMTLALECGPRGAPGISHVPLLEAPSIGATVSLEGCSIFVETTSSKGATWTVFSSETGERLGLIAREPGSWNPATASGYAYYLIETPVDGARVRTFLRAVDLKNGTKRWELPVRSRSGKP